MAEVSRQIPLIAAGACLVEIVVADDADDQTRHAAGELSRWLGRSTGVQVPVAGRSDRSTLTSVFVGAVPEEERRSLESELAELDSDGYVIDVSEGRVIIAGPSPWGTRFGVLEFLERFVGVRWLMPGEHGVDVPAHQEISVPCGHWSDQPAFWCRSWLQPHESSEWHSEDPLAEWAAQNRTHNKLSHFDHAMWQIFAPGRFARSNPEFYPILQGRRYLPEPGERLRWQPRFSEPGTVEVAAQYCIDLLVAHPELPGCGLSANDSGGFSEDELDVAQLDANGLYSHSAVYWDWINRVAERVAERFPDKIIAGYAYSQTAEPPPFPLSPMVMPILCHDRYAWVDEGDRHRIMALHERWRAVSTQLGTYDYCYGAPYTVPRLHAPILQDAYRFLADHGVSKAYAELCPNWAEGPKAWLFTKLLWNPEIDLEAASREWCERAVGPAAAPALLDHLALWSGVWLDVLPRSEWYRTGRGRPYFRFEDASYQDSVPLATVEQSAELLVAMVEAAETEPQRWRASVIARSFDYHHASALSHPRPVPAPSTAAEARQLADDTLAAADRAAAAARRRHQLLSDFEPDPILRHRVKPFNWGIDWPGIDPHPIWALVDFVHDHDADQLRTHLDSIDATPFGPDARHGLNLLRQAVGTPPRTVGSNLDLADGTDGWAISHNVPPLAVAEVVEAPDGNRDLTLTGPISACRISQDLVVMPGPIRASFLITGVDGDQGTATITASWQFLNADGTVSSKRNAARQTVRETPFTVSAVDIVPEDVGAARYTLSVEYLPAGSQLRCRPLQCEQLGQP